MQSPILVSLLLITWNSGKYLNDCLDHLLAQTFNKFEVILVDNGSEDGAVDGLHENYPSLDLHIHRLNSNLGFAKANNIGSRLARGQWLALLNVDAFPEPDWLAKLLGAAETRPAYASFSSRQIQVDRAGLLDGAGDAYHVTGLAWRRYYGKPAQAYGHQFEEVFSACPAAALYSREAFLEAGGFDEDYFSYFEDVDLGFRLRLNGVKCLYVPEAVVHHVGSASTGKRSDFSVYYGYRNLIWTFVKDMPSLLFWIFLPFHVGMMLFFVIYLTLRGQGAIICRAILDAMRGLPRMIAKRGIIQRNKKIMSGELLRVMSIGLLEPYREFVQRNKK